MKLTDRYHPERFRALHPLARQLATIYKADNGLKMATYETFQKISNLVMQTYNKTISALPIDQRPADLKAVWNYISIAMHYAAFCVFGRQIFHFNEEIVEQFRRTDISEVTLDTLRFPYEVFYISFGPQFDLTLNHNVVVDGAYISMFNLSNEQDRSLQILLTSNEAVSTIAPLTQNAKEFEWVLRPQEYYYLSVPLNDPSLSVSSAVEKAFNADMEEKRQSLQKQLPAYEDAGKVVINRRPDSLKREMRELEDGYPSFREALKLIINGLCYISAYPDDIEAHWPADTPANLLDKIRISKKPKELARTTSRLVSMGYTKIHFCGKAFEHVNKSALPTGREVKAHWRRGHWRNQVCGPQLSKRKLIWVMPVIVHKESAEALSDEGHIYSLDSDKESQV